VAGGSGGQLLAIGAEGNLPEGCRQQPAAAKTLVTGSPTSMGMVSRQFKKFADASSKPCFGLHWKDKLAAGFTNSASMHGDEHATLRCLFTLSQQHGMFRVTTGSAGPGRCPLGPAHWQRRQKLARCSHRVRRSAPISDLAVAGFSQRAAALETRSAQPRFFLQRMCQADNPKA